jgi:hypothetical protein
MLSIRTYPTGGLTPRRSRRQFLQAGALGAFGLSLETLLAVPAAAKPVRTGSFGRAKQCIVVYLSGGPSQLDLLDLKPDAPAEIRGALKPIDTNVPGVRISEMLPLTARQADKFTILRSLTHNDTEHTTSFYTMLTGTYHPRPGVVQPRGLPSDHPHLGAITAKHRGWQQGMPPFVSLPTLFQPPGNGVWPGQTGGFLGQRYGPVVVQGDKQTGRFRLPALELPVDIPVGRLQDRRHLLGRLDRAVAGAEAGGQLAGQAAVAQQAFSIISSTRARRAFDLDEEPVQVRDRYGRHLFGQGLLLARRLCEAGVRLVTVYWIDPAPPGPGGGEWDSHGQIYRHMRERLVAPADRGLAALFADLGERGLLDDTLVVVMAEFGRSPRLNKDAGRAHWPQVQSVVLAGAGIPGGRVFGTSDRFAAYPATDPVTPPDLAQTVLHLLGVPADLELTDPQGKPVRACQGTAITKLLA